MKYDLVTRWLHAALALGIVAQLGLSSVMHVPAGVGLGVRDWHRAAFEIHAKVGLAVAAVCLLHWLWVFLPAARPGWTHLFPWLRREQRGALAQETRNLLQRRFPAPPYSGPLAGTVHGLGLLALTGSAVSGMTNYLGYFRGVPIPRSVLHWVGEFHISMGYLMWAFVIAHVLMALRHRFSGDASIFAGIAPY